MLVSRLLLALSTAAVTLAANPARAEEGEWDTGIAFGWAVTESTNAGAVHGFGGVASTRYGITDAIELDFNVAAMGYPDKSRMIFGTSAGASYLVDVSRWVLWLGANVGVFDVWRGSCGAAVELCRHEIRPSVGLPAGFEYRVERELPIGVRFEYQFLFLGEPSSQIFLGAYVGFIR